jgi:ATP-dependent RNA helicase RhlE
MEVQVAARNSVVATVTHRAHPVDNSRKRDLLLELLSRDSRRQTLVFTRTKHGANRLCEQLEKSGLRAQAIHGNKSQGARVKALNDFKNGRCTILVATDIAARGIDIDQLPWVVNFDLPTIAEDYVHRIGRTGRNGSTGEAISLVSPEEGPLLREIQRLLKQDIAMEVVEGYAPSRPLQMNGSIAAARRPQTPAGQRPQQHARRPHTSAPRTAHAAGNRRGGESSSRGNAGGRRDAGSR